MALTLTPTVFRAGIMIPFLREKGNRMIAGPYRGMVFPL